MLKWAIINKNSCLSQSIWNRQVNCKDDKSKSLGKSWRFRTRVTASMITYQYSKSDWSDVEKEEKKVSNDHVRNRSWYLRMLRTQHIRTHLLADLDTLPIVVSYISISVCIEEKEEVVVTTTTTNTTTMNILRSDRHDQQAKYLNVCTYKHRNDSCTK